MFSFKDTLKNIRSGLLIQAQDEVVEEGQVDIVPETPEEMTWARPHISPRAPMKFPYGEKRLLPVDDARKVKKTADALFDRKDRLDAAETKYTNLRVQAEQKIAGLKDKEGYASLKEELDGFMDKLGTEILSSMDDASDILYQHGTTLMSVYQVSEKPQKVSIDKQQLLKDSIMKYVSEDIAGKILEESDKAVKDAEEASKVLKNKLGMWTAPKGVDKKVRQVETSIQKNAITIKEIFSGVGDAVKSFYNKAKDTMSSLMSSIQTANPLITEMQDVLNDVGMTAVSTK